MGIKHAAVYQCAEAFCFLKLLVAYSERFKNKGDMENALIKIMPPSVRKKQESI